MEMQKTVVGALQGSSGVMANLNKDMDVKEISQVLKEFNKEMGKAEMNQEMVNDAFEMMEDPGAQADADDLYNGILGEIGLQYEMGQPAVPVNKINQPAAQVQEENKVDNDLEARLAALRM